MHLDAETGNSSNTVPSSQPEDGEFFGEVGDVKEPCAPHSTQCRRPGGVSMRFAIIGLC